MVASIPGRGNKKGYSIPVKKNLWGKLKFEKENAPCPEKKAGDPTVDYRFPIISKNTYLIRRYPCFPLQLKTLNRSIENGIITATVAEVPVRTEPGAVVIVDSS